MPTRPLKACPSPGCPELVVSGRCPRHRRPNEHPESAFYRSRPWRSQSERLRRRIKTCQCTTAHRWHLGPQVCGMGATPGHPLQADHIVSLTDGGARHDEANLQVLCWRCHEQKTAADRRARKRGS